MKTSEQDCELATEAPQPPQRLRFNPPLEFAGKEYDELVFDFGGVKNGDFERAERTLFRRYKSERKTAVAPEAHIFNCILMAYMANVPLGVIESLPARHYRALSVELLKVYAARGRKRRRR